MIAAAVVLLTALLVIPRLTGRSAAERHLLWVAALAIAAVLPVLTPIALIAQGPIADVLARVLPRSLSGYATDRSVSMVVHATGVEGTSIHLAASLYAVWAVGTLVCAVLVARQLHTLRLIARTACPALNPRILAHASLAAARAHVDAATVVISDTLRVPATWGVRRPRIVLPPEADTWSDEFLASVLAHELAHIARRDWLTHMATEALCAVYWFNPFFWLGRAALKRESEHAADDAVLAAGVDAADYAGCLVDVLRTMRQRCIPNASVAIARSSDVASRVRCVLDPATNRSPVTAWKTITTSLAAAVVASAAAVFGAPAFAAEVRVAPASLPAILRDPLTAAEPRVSPAARVRLADAHEANIKPPAVLEYSSPPLYSEDARRLRIEGTTTIRVHMDQAGHVAAARVIRSLGYGLDQNAVVAVRHWRFSPARRDGRAVAVVADIDVEFSLRNEAINELIANDMATQVGPGVVPPRVIETARPVTSRARGRVVLDVVLREDGTPRIVRILESGGAELDEAAVRAFEQWRFSPASKDGRAVKVRMTAEMDFHG